MDFQKVEQEYQALEILLNPVANWDFYGSKNFAEFLGHKGREYRLAHHIRPDSIAEKTGRSKSHVAVLETGHANRGSLGFRFYQTYLMALGLSLNDLLTHGTASYESSPTEKGLRHKPTKFSGQAREEYYQLRVKSAIDKLTKSDALPSAAAIAQVSGVSLSVIYNYPNLRRLLPRATPRLNEFYQRRSRDVTQQVQDAWDQLSSDGKIPTNSEITQILGSYSFDNFPEARAWLKQARRTVRATQMVRLEDSIIERLNKIEIEQDPNGCNLTKSGVCRRLGIHHRKLSELSKIRNRVLELTRNSNPHYRRKRVNEDDLILQVQKIQEDLRAQGIQITQRRIADRMGRTVPSLQRYPRVKALFREIAHPKKKGKCNDI